MSSSALMVYALSKGYSFLWGPTTWSRVFLWGRPGNIFSAGLILPLDICVGLGGRDHVLLFIPCSGKGRCDNAGACDQLLRDSEP